MTKKVHVEKARTEEIALRNVRKKIKEYNKLKLSDRASLVKMKKISDGIYHATLKFKKRLFLGIYRQ